MTTYVIKVGPSEAVAVNLRAGSAVRCVREGSPDMTCDPFTAGLPRLLLVLWGTEFGGAWVCRYESLNGIRKGHFERDRRVWLEAARLIRNGGAARLPHERSDCHGEAAWVALSATYEAAVAAEEPLPAAPVTCHWRNVFIGRDREGRWAASHTGHPDPWHCFGAANGEHMPYGGGK